MIHTTTRTLEATFFNLTKTPLTLFLNQAARFAVPLFFMISGFVLELNFRSNENYLVYLKKRFSRIIVPYVFWSFIYYFLIYKKHAEDFFIALLKGDASYQLYFIPTLLVFYLLFPILHKYLRIIGNKWLMLTLAFIEFLFLYFDYFVHPLGFFYPLSIAFLNYFTFLFGIYLADNQEKFISFIRKWRLFLMSTSLFLAFYIFWEGETLYLKTHNYLSFYSQWRPSVLIYTIVLGGTLYYIFDRKYKSLVLIKTLARLSFFVFFIHVIILEQFWKFFGKDIFAINGETMWWDLLFFAVVAIISFSLAFLAHKIPYLSKITG